MPPNDYKQDVGKVPLLAALQPFMPALYALARMMDDMKHKHRLAGSSDPFNQWAQLPEAEARMAEALLRHLLPEEGTLWDVNTKDGSHLHATHGLFNLLGSLTLHLRELARMAAQDALRVAAAAPADMAHVLAAAKAELWRQGERGHFWTGDHGTWHCTCGAGRPEACTCDQSKGGTGVNL